MMRIIILTYNNKRLLSLEVDSSIAIVPRQVVSVVEKEVVEVVIA